MTKEHEFCGKWIKTAEIMPPKGEWVLVTTGSRQKTVDIKCYMGKRTQKVYRYIDGIQNEYDDVYDAWTSGHGDISNTSPEYWAPLPELPS